MQVVTESESELARLLAFHLRKVWLHSVAILVPGDCPVVLGATGPWEELTNAHEEAASHIVCIDECSALLQHLCVFCLFKRKVSAHSPNCYHGRLGLLRSDELGAHTTVSSVCADQKGSLSDATVSEDGPDVLGALLVSDKLLASVDLEVMLKPLSEEGSIRTDLVVAVIGSVVGVYLAEALFILVVDTAEVDTLAPVLDAC